MVSANGPVHIYQMEKTKLMYLKIPRNYNNIMRLRCFLSIIIIVLPVLSACSQQAKNQALAFFFTGVPSVEETKKKEVSTEIPSSLIGNEIEQASFSAHSYFTEKKCSLCHQPYLTRNFRESTKKGRTAIVFADDITTDSSDQPLKEVCVNCHENRSDTYAAKNNLWLHAPVSKGNCIVCHSPHQSNHSHLLRDTPEKVCLMCHSTGLMRHATGKQKTKNCIKCHNPHLGKNNFLLAKEYKEIRQLPEISGTTFNR